MYLQVEERNISLSHMRVLIELFNFVLLTPLQKYIEPLLVCVFEFGFTVFTTPMYVDHFFSISLLVLRCEIHAMLSISVFF